MTGAGVQQDFSEAYLWFNLAAEQDHQEATQRLTELTRMMSPEELFAGRLLNAERGDLEDQFRVGTAYLNGFGIKTNPTQAINWLRQAAEQGHPEAQLELGQAYATGHGVAQDFTKAREWHELAAARAEMKQDRARKGR